MKRKKRRSKSNQEKILSGKKVTEEIKRVSKEILRRKRHKKIRVFKRKKKKYIIPKNKIFDAEKCLYIDLADQ